MDLPAIATEAAALLAGYVLAIGRDVADKASTAAADRLFGLVKDKFAGDSENTQTLENLMREPANGEHQEAVAAALSGALEDDPSFGEQLRLSITEVKQSYGEVEQTITATGPVAGNQIVSNIGSGTSISDSIVNNQGSVDQSVHTTHDQRRITNKRGAGALWPIGVAVGLVIAGITTLAITTGTDERIQGSPTRLPQVGATGTTQSSTTPVADPPLEISSDGTSLGVPLEGNYAVHEGAAYFVEGDEMAIGGEYVLVAAELATGEHRWSLPVQVDSNQEGSPHMIEVTDANGEPMVFLVALVTTEGTGTSVDRTVKQVTAVSAVDGRPQWTYDYTEPEASPRDTPYPVVSGSHMVIADGEQVVVLDPSTGKTKGSWRGAADFTTPKMLSGDTVVVIERTLGELGYNDDQRVVARSVSNGKPLWTMTDTNSDVIPLGPELGAVIDTDPSPGSITPTWVVDFAARKVVAEFDVGYFAWFDGDATIVFQKNDDFNSDSHVFAIDIESYKTLWELPDEAAGRFAPEIIDVHNGAVYAYSENGPLILDARTGEDKVTDLPFTPDSVTAGYVLVYNEDEDLVAYPATS